MADQRHNAKMNHVDLYVTPALFYIETLVKALNKKNSKAIAQELNTVSAYNGMFSTVDEDSDLTTIAYRSADSRDLQRTVIFYKLCSLGLIFHLIHSLS